MSTQLGFGIDELPPDFETICKDCKKVIIDTMYIPFIRVGEVTDQGYLMESARCEKCYLEWGERNGGFDE